MPTTVATPKDIAALDKRLKKLENISKAGKTLKMVVDRLNALEKIVDNVHDLIMPIIKEKR